MHKKLLRITPIDSKLNLLRLSRLDQRNAQEVVVLERDLEDKRAHLFIASHTWEMLDLTVTKNTAVGLIPIILSKCEGIKISIECEMTFSIVNMLCECFPNRKGELRKAFLLKKDVLSVL